LPENVPCSAVSCSVSAKFGPHMIFLKRWFGYNKITQGDMHEYKIELDNIPHSFKASFNLSRIFRILKREEEEIKWLDKTMEINPNFPLSYFYLARIYLNQGQKFREAISLIKKGIELKPEKKELPLGYFLLADLYNRLGDNEKSLDYAQKGKNASTNAKKH
jgi:tetratricopeptide (TPR) repeat protein